MTHSKENAKEIAITTAFIFKEMQDEREFFSFIDQAYQIAKKFVDKYPPSTNWEEQPSDWESTLCKFIQDSLQHMRGGN